MVKANEFIEKNEESSLAFKGMTIVGLLRKENVEKVARIGFLEGQLDGLSNVDLVKEDIQKELDVLTK